MDFESIIAQINSVEITTTSSIFKLVLSMALGSLVGYERKRKGQIAGIRTFSLICMGATLAMILSIYVPQEYLGLKNGDPSRIAAQVVSGIGFLGAGAIIQMKGSVRGLTTAAGIWMIAALGMTVGLGMYIVAIVATFLMLFVLMQLERIEHRVNLGSESRTIVVNTQAIVDDINKYKDLLAAHSIHVINYFIAYDFTNSSTKINLVVLARENVDFMALFADMRDLYPTTNISLTNQVSI